MHAYIDLFIIIIMLLYYKSNTQNLASSPGPPSLSMLHAVKREGLVGERTCVTPLRVMLRMYRKVTSRPFQATVFERKVC